MTTVILANMGSATSEAEMKSFLQRMFLDKAIIPAPYPVRLMLSCLISRTRYKKSWGKYKLIGGSPLVKSMNSIQQDLQMALGADYKVLNAYSYSEPQLTAYLKKEADNKTIVVPLYPQASISTTGSVETEVQNFTKKHKDSNIRITEDFYQNKAFINYWSELIQETLQKEKMQDAHLVFSAHSIPEKYVEKGDQYAKKVRASAKLIAEQLGLPYSVGFQSRIGKMKWVCPDTQELLHKLVKTEKKQLLLVPIAFVNENLETRYDLDIEIMPAVQKRYPDLHIARAIIPDSHPQLINCLKEKIHEIESI